jgi:hypothetical protein
VPEIVKPLTERQILKGQAGKTLTDEQEFLKLLVNQISSMQTDNAQGMEKLVAAFRNIKVEVAQAPAPEVKVEVEAAKSPEVLVNIDSPKEWEFTVFRDHNGLIERLLAIRKK